MVLPRLIGLFGGTFDPVHYGHLRLAREVYAQAGLDELRFIPCHMPTHRAPATASSDQRLIMLNLALQEFPEFVIDEREINRAGHSYTFDTLSELRHELPDARLCWLMGMDAFLDFTRWHKWRHILELAHLLVAVRPGYTAPADGDMRTLLDRHALDSVDTLRCRVAGGIVLLETPANDIASTHIRAKLAKGQSIHNLVPPAIEQWLYEHPVYHYHQNNTLCN